MTVRELVRGDMGATLSRRGWLSRTPSDFQQAVLEHCVVQRRSAGEPLYYSGDEIGGMFGVIDGTVEIASGFGNPDAYIVHLAQAGFWIGEGSILIGKPRMITAAARTDATLAYLPLVALRGMVIATPEYWRYLGQLSVEHNNLSTSGAADLMIRDVDRRCIAVLLRLAGCRFRINDGDARPEVVVSQEELAAMANLSRKSVGDVLRPLEQAGVIELGYRSIRINLPHKLREILAVD